MTALRADGYNPIRHDCQRNGCYLVECHPKTEWFASCFRGKISFSDMDRIVEVGGRALVIEWKGPGGKISFAQELMWKRLTRGGMFTVIAVNGDPKEMIVDSYRLCYEGKWQEWQESSTIDLRDRIKNWNEWAESHPVFSVTVNGAKE